MKPTTIQGHADMRADAMRIMEADIGNEWTVIEVAELMCVSKRSLQRSFEVGGTTFRDELTRTRMVQAAGLILARRFEHPVPTIKDIARRVGYRQPAQFAKAFVRINGIGPTQYEKEAVNV